MGMLGVYLFVALASGQEPWVSLIHDGGVGIVYSESIAALFTSVLVVSGGDSTWSGIGDRAQKWVQSRRPSSGVVGSALGMG